MSEILMILDKVDDRILRKELEGIAFLISNATNTTMKDAEYRDKAKVINKAKRMVLKITHELRKEYEKMSKPEDNNDLKDKNTNEDGGDEDNKEIDYKEEYEKIKSQKEKIASDYSNLQGHRDRLESTLSKTLSSTGSYIDNDGNIVANKTSEPKAKNDPLSDIESQIKKNKADYENGDIEQDTYFERRQDLVAEKATLRATADYERKVKKESADNQKQSVQNKYKSLIEKDFPDLYDKDSDLYKEMAKLYDDDTEAWGSVNNDFVDQYKLARLARQSLKSKGLFEDKEKTQRDLERRASFSDIHTSMYASGYKEKDAIFSEGEKEKMARRGVTKDDIARLEKLNPHLADRESLSLKSMQIPM